jgi:hypothetical protein
LRVADSLHGHVDCVEFPRRLAALLLTGSLALVAGSLSADDAAPPLLLIQGVSVNGSAIAFESDRPLRLPAGANNTTIIFGPSASESNAPLRLRSQLDGYENVWHERTDKMRLMIRFQDNALNEVSVKEFAVSGQSPGWTGSFSNCPSVHRRETVLVPTNASRFWLIMSSAGPAGSVGVYGIKNLRFSSADPGAEVRQLITTLDPRAPESLGPRRRSVEGWTRSGLRWSNALVVRSGAERELTLVLVDDSAEAHTDWITPKSPGLRVQPGEELVFEWDEFYSVGLAGSGIASYEKLPAGLYRLRMEGLTVMGVPNGSEASIAVEVPVPFWQTGWFWLGTIFALAGLVTGAWRLSEWRRMKLQLAAVEKTRAVELE